MLTSFANLSNPRGETNASDEGYCMCIFQIDRHVAVYFSLVFSLLAFVERREIRAQSLSDDVTSAKFRDEDPRFRGLDANLYMQTSAEYRAACYQAYQFAGLRLAEALKSSEGKQKKFAVVMDLDETVFDNSGFQGWMLQNGTAYDQRWFDRWEEFGGEAVGLVPGAKEFILETEKLGVTIVHISNRNDRYRAMTKKTLDRLGIPVINDRNLKLSTTSSDKTARRKEVEETDGFTVLLFVGDNLRDFDERFKTPSLSLQSSAEELNNAIAQRKAQVDQMRKNWGTKWIVLPNPAYGEWSKPLGRGEQDVERLTGSGTPIGLAFWNVENLFDLVDDPAVEGDEEFTPSGPNQWTVERMEIKLKNLASVINRMHSNRGPDVLGLAEVENRDVVEALVKTLAATRRDYRIVHQDSPSDRGIDCALIYDAKVLTLAEAKFHYVEADKTRDILEAKFTRNNASLTVFINHWPSRGNDVSFRIKAGQTLRTRIDELLKTDALADIVAMGDFNDYPTDESIVKALGTVGELAELRDSKLFNSSFTTTPDASTGTYVYNDKWDILDQVILSPGLLIPGGVSWSVGTTRPVVLVDDQLFDMPGPAIPRPSRSYSKTTFHKTGYSDHLPVVTTINW